MTVSYQYDVASSTSGGFTRLLFKWRGSLFKLIYRELAFFLIIFALLSILYRYGINEDQKRSFERLVLYCDTFINMIPLSFVLGFYVSFVASRWWQQYMAIPWPDKIMHCIAMYVAGNDELGRMIRRTLMRYLNLSLILVLRSISSAVKKRLPTLDHVVSAGFMTKIELDMFSSVPSEEFNTYWIPCTWFISLLKDARRSNRIADPQGLKMIMEEFCDFRAKCGMLWSYDWVSIPLVYTQVVTLATYFFFIAAAIGRQHIDNDRISIHMEIDKYIPLFTILQFFFYMGLLKVAEQLINPFGDDDEDFELNWIIDRHTKVSYLGVDLLMRGAPPLVKDKYFDEKEIVLPYTEASLDYKKRTYRGSVADMMCVGSTDGVPQKKQSMLLPEIVEVDEEANIGSRKVRTGSIIPGEATPKIIGTPSEKRRGSVIIPHFSNEQGSPYRSRRSAPSILLGPSLSPNLSLRSETSGIRRGSSQSTTLGTPTTTSGVEGVSDWHAGDIPSTAGVTTTPPFTLRAPPRNRKASTASSLNVPGASSWSVGLDKSELDNNDGSAYDSAVQGSLGGDDSNDVTSTDLPSINGHAHNKLPVLSIKHQHQLKSPSSKLRARKLAKRFNIVPHRKGGRKRQTIVWRTMPEDDDDPSDSYYDTMTLRSERSYDAYPIDLMSDTGIDYIDEDEHTLRGHPSRKMVSFHDEVFNTLGSHLSMLDTRLPIGVGEQRPCSLREQIQLQASAPSQLFLSLPNLPRNVEPFHHLLQKNMLAEMESDLYRRSSKSFSPPLTGQQQKPEPDVRNRLLTYLPKWLRRDPSP